MFVTFTGLPFPKRRFPIKLWQQIADWISPPPPEIHKAEVLDSFFTDIRVHHPSKDLDGRWEELSRLSCRLALCGTDIPLPPGYRYAVSRTQTENLLCRISGNTAAHIMGKSELPLYCRCVGIIDPDCSHPGLAEKLIPYVPEIVVYTENPTLYHGYSEKLLDEYGAPLTFAENLLSLRRCSLILCLGEITLPSLYPTPVLSPYPQKGDHNLWISRFSFGVPQADAVIPPGIDKDEFYTALYERCSISQIGTLCASSARCGQREVSLQEIIYQIQRNQAGSLMVG